MKVQMGNATPHKFVPGSTEQRYVYHDDPIVVVWDSRGGDSTHVVAGRPNGKDALIYVLTHDIVQMPDHTAFLSIVRDWPSHSPNSPSWVDSDDEPDLALMLSEAYGCPVGIPEDVEQTHHTISGPPGVGPTTEA